jgi:hypothetical protein
MVKFTPSTKPGSKGGGKSSKGSTSKSSSKPSANYDPNPDETPWKWEVSELGLTPGDRLQALGHQNVEFNRRLGEEPYHAESLVTTIVQPMKTLNDGQSGGKKLTAAERKLQNGSKSGNWSNVSKLGGDSMKLIDGGVVDDELERLSKVRGIESNDDDDEESNAASDSDDSDDDRHPNSSTPKASDDTQHDDNLILDNDWDTTDWSLSEIEAACSTLLNSIEGAPYYLGGENIVSSTGKHKDKETNDSDDDNDHDNDVNTATNNPNNTKHKATKMLLRLLHHHGSAVSYIQKVAESLIQKTFPPTIQLKGLGVASRNLGVSS